MHLRRSERCPRRSPWRDGVLAVCVAAAAVTGALLAPPAGTHLDQVAYLLMLTGALALAVRTRWPVPVLLISTGCMLVYHLRDFPGNAGVIPLLVALYTAVRFGHRRLAVVPALAMVVAIVKDAGGLGGTPADNGSRETFLLLGWLVAAAVFGEVSRQRSAYIRQVEERAAEAERTREEMARRRAGEERLRIARELHDSLTHSISVIKVQAGVAVHLARKRGEEVPPTLLAIQEASGDALRELRATLEVLRTPQAEEDADGAGPASGLDRLPQLVERARSTGLPVRLEITGGRRPLPEETDRAAYRIVQEALTNITRHAGPAAPARVRVDYRPGELAVEIEDDGRATADQPPVPGTGLLGMRERVAALGGTLDARPRPEGGFAVRARLPLAPVPAMTGGKRGAR
ncbi:sensor histidine kinase [Streptomyces aidingensis]|nr:sensor histidine kinase [Streptomyces aidingensis]